MLLRGFVVWLGFVLLAVANGLVRETQLIPRLGVARGGQLSAFLLALGILLITYFTIAWLEPARRGDPWLLGAFWLVLVLLFEFGLGRAQGTSWSAMLAEYEFWKGRLWVLVLLATLIAPYVTAELRHLELGGE